MAAGMTRRRVATWIASGYRNIFGRRDSSAAQRQLLRDDRLAVYFVRTASHYRRHVNPVFREAVDHGDRVAVRDNDGEYSYLGLVGAAATLADQLTATLRGALQHRVVLALPNDASYVIALWACWISGQIAVPIALNHPSSMIEFFVADSESSLVLTVPEFEAEMKDIVAKVGCRLHIITDHHRKMAMKPVVGGTKTMDVTDDNRPVLPTIVNPHDIGQDTNFYANNDALVVYTSGATGTPRGVLLDFVNIQSQVRSLVEALGWDKKVSMLHVLPLNNIHGIVDVLLCPLSLGARCVMMKEFDSADVWAELLGVNRSGAERINAFTAVGWMYDRLIDQYDRSLSKSEKMTTYIRSSCMTKVRLMSSVLSPLPSRVHDRWEQITGHRILEQYGTTETGTVFSSVPNDKSKQGTVGHPLPGVYTRLISETDGRVVAEGSHLNTRVVTEGSSVMDHRVLVSVGKSFVVGGESGADLRLLGSLEVRGEGVSHRYWKKPIVELTPDWFGTGDIVEYDGAYKVLGEKSRDMIRTGGFTVSALEVETALADNEAVREAVVVPLKDSTWGYKLAALVVPKAGHSVTDRDLVSWATGRLAEHEVPTLIKLVDAIPRSHAGKPNRADLASRFFAVGSAAVQSDE